MQPHHLYHSLSWRARSRRWTHTGGWLRPQPPLSPLLSTPSGACLQVSLLYLSLPRERGHATRWTCSGC